MSLSKIMSLVDANADKLPDGAYLEICNELKAVWKRPPPPRGGRRRRQKKRKGSMSLWTSSRSTSASWKKRWKLINGTKSGVRILRT